MIHGSRNMASLWCHHEPYLGCLHHPMPSPSIPPAFPHLRRWDVSCRHSPGSANTAPCQGQHPQMLGQQRQAVGQPQDQQRAARQMLPVSAPWGIRDCKYSAPGRVVMLPHVSLREQHDARRGVQSTAFDVLQWLGNENKRSACMGKN